ncbi:MAG: hypothetical protein OHK0052_27230 [Anaerolineales bacterium]
MFQITPNRRYLATAVYNGILVWNLQQPTEDPGKLLTGHIHVAWVGSIRTLAFNPNARSGRLLASTGYDETLRLWDVGSGALLRTFSDTRRDLFLLCFSGDGRYLAAYGYDGALRLFGIP